VRRKAAGRMAAISTIRTKDGVEWHCERQGQGPHLVLVPSGEGDCASFAKVAAILADSFAVTTFDMPGMSRSTAPEAAMADLTATKLASQVIGLLDELSIDIATFYGCSSGGLVVLTLAYVYPERVRSVIVHEVPLTKTLGALTKLDDEAIVNTCRNVVEEIVGDKDAWAALGPDYHARLDRNYVTWVRKYVDRVERSFTKEELTVRPVDWTIGALSPAGLFFSNVVAACHAGIPIGLLNSRHFPQVTIPDVLAEHILAAATKHSGPSY
jgi:pimeloyl-ACP methyl ester carboxylesterase